MLDLQQARKKLSHFTSLPKTHLEYMSPYVEEICLSVLEGNEITMQDTWMDPGSPQYVTWLENRLSASHLKYLSDLSQVNDKWGVSTTKALAELVKVYKLKGTNPTLNSLTLRALLDGTLGATPVARTLYQQVKSAVLKKKHKWFDDPMRMNLVGVRGFLLTKGSVKNVPNIYNDTMFVCWKGYKGEELVQEYACSVDPGYYYYHIAPLNQDGCAHLKEGQYSYQLGIHRYYEALVQAGPVTVYRSSRGNFKKTDKQTTGWYGINIHAGTPGPTVYNASAGCQVILCGGPYSPEWLGFMNLIKQSIIKRYEYVLLESM